MTGDVFHFHKTDGTPPPPPTLAHEDYSLESEVRGSFHNFEPIAISSTTPVFQLDQMKRKYAGENNTSEIKLQATRNMGKMLCESKFCQISNNHKGLLLFLGEKGLLLFLGETLGFQQSILIIFTPR